jgi:transposase
MPGTVRKIIERIKEKRSGGNSVVALTVETRLVLQGFDPQRFEYDTPDDAGRLARLSEIAREMNVDVSDLLDQADVEPDPEATPPDAPAETSAAEAARAAAAQATATVGTRLPQIPDDHPLRRFREIADSTLAQLGGGRGGDNSGASFEVLLKSSALMALYSIHKDSVFCDLLRYDVLFQWFLDLDPDRAQFDPDTFFADREKALATANGKIFFDRLVPAAGRDKLFSKPVFQVDSSAFKGWMTPRGDLR